MARCALDSSSLSSALATPRTLPPEAPPCHAREPATRHMSGSCGRYGARLGFMAGILHRCAQLPAAAGGGLAGAAALTKPQSRVRPMTLLFFRCKVLTRSLTRRRQDPGLDSARGMAHPRAETVQTSAGLGGGIEGTPHSTFDFIHAAVGVHSASMHSRRVASSRPPLHSCSWRTPRAPLGLPWG